uniref:Uncharacterized protein n=1 Tax=Rhizophora mucronata TaxID=61149 RepID=A0A2P2PFK7_RHIMU
MRESFVMWKKVSFCE